MVKSSAKSCRYAALLPWKVETLINHVAEQERLREEHEQARKHPQRILRHNEVEVPLGGLHPPYSQVTHRINLHNA